MYEQTLRWFSAKAGLEAEHFMSHLLRRQCTTYLSLYGVTIEEIKVKGDWASETVYTYLHTPLSVPIMDDMKAAASFSVESDRLVWGKRAPFGDFAQP